MQPPTVKGKPPVQKPLCRLCECPTSDGHVLASQVDRIKLRTWAMKVLELTATDDDNLPMLIGIDHLICYFCLWQAEFDDETGDEAVAWWPENLDLDENARILRENYSIGEVDQCWVQLEEIDLSKYEKEIPKKTNRSGVCFYCGRRFNGLMNHIKSKHKEAIKCGIRGCRTFFHTEEEKEQHMIEDSHEKRNKPCECRKIRCKYCEIGKFYSSVRRWRWHLKQYHPEFPVMCSRYGCKKFFKTKSEMILHINSWHKRGVNEEIFQCEHCEYFTTQEYSL
ncbi:uncharacterized protein LOC135942844 [Cloeon dipterum]|uniref:uncharacterized protein LOC135942844 n=1 Tax=Cloeon dipterum TaxID=197152 RepID=UPI003220702A